MDLRTLWPWLLLLTLDGLLFLPSFVLTEPGAQPIGPGFHGLLVALLVERPSHDVFRYAVELGGVVALVLLSARARLRAAARIVGALAYVVLLLFLVYHHGVYYFFERPPALGEDWRLALNLAHFANAMVPTFGLALCGAGALLVLASLGWLTAFMLRGLQLQAGRWRMRTRVAVSLGLVLPAALLGWRGIESDETVVQLASKRVVDNWRTSQAEAARMAELRSGVSDRRYDAFSGVRLQRRPSFYLLLVEAYGESLATSDMTDSYRALMARVESRLGAAGFHARTGYSAAPVHGGTSWFSIATVHTGVLIDRPLAYGALELIGGRVPSLTRFFEASGYRTYTLQPGTTDHAGIRRFDLFNHDVVVTAPDLRYRGKKYGFGVIPDQYSLGKFRQRYLDRAEEPRYLFYMNVSTHLPWGKGVPPYVRDWRALQHGEGEVSDVDASWPALPGKDAIGNQQRRGYFRSIEYEWRLLTEWLETETASDLIVLVVGDHQPRLRGKFRGGVTMNTPVHVLARDAAFAERFAKLGFERGMFAQPHVVTPLNHAGLYSLMVSQLAAAYGAEGSPAATYVPEGIGLTGLNR
jgi:hypothetical protein